jgi:NitT/TauT family transport system substrate-binding protein
MPLAKLIFVLAALLLAQGAAAQTKLSFYTDWKAQAEHGGYYQAKATGLYSKAGLDVTIRPGGPNVDVIRLLAAGAVDVAMVSDSFQAMRLAARGADAKIVMAVFQKDPQIIMAHGTGKAPRLSAWKNKPLFMDDGFRLSYFPWLKARHGFTDKQVRPYGFSLTPWLLDKNALQEGYLSSEPFSALKAKADTQVIVLSDQGFTGYGQMVAVTGKMLRERPQLVKAFVQATQSGWQSYLSGNPGPGNALIRKDNGEMSDELIAYGRSALIARGIVISGDATTQGVGAMTSSRWAGFVAEMKAIGLAPASLEASRIYDLRFLASHGR